MISGTTENTFGHGWEATLSLVRKRETTPDSERWWQEWVGFLQITARWEHRTRNRHNYHVYDKHWPSKPPTFLSFNTIHISPL